jgi:pilus assembly protein CpaC
VSPRPFSAAQEPAASAPGVWDAQEEALIDWVLEPGIPLEIDPRRSKIIRTKRPITRISVTDPDILEVVQFGPTEFELIGGSTGQTSLTLWFADANGGGEILRYLVRVSPDQAIEDRRKIEYAELEKKINEFFPDSMVRLIPIADKLIVKGQARDAEEATQIMALVRGQAPDGTILGGGGAMLNRGVAAEPFPGVSDLPASDVINLLHVTGEMQVMLKVRVAELSRTALRELGTELDVFAGDFTFETNLGLAGAVRAVLDTDDVRFVLEALNTNSYGKVLAEPNLVTLSGHPAYFIAGGEFAVPTVVGVEGVGAVSTNFRGFGTQLMFTPTVLDKDRIRMHVAPSFSQVNEDLTSQDGVPGLDTRAVATTVDLREGQWLAIAGLLQDQQSGSHVRVPFVGDIPVAGTIFSNRDVRREETELLVLVSPELVHPLEAEEAPQILPGMEVTEPGDWGFYVTGRIEGHYDCHYRSTYGPAYKQHLIDARIDAKRHGAYLQSEGYYIQGEHGFSR